MSPERRAVGGEDTLRSGDDGGHRLWSSGSECLAPPSPVTPHASHTPAASVGGTLLPRFHLPDSATDMLEIAVTETIGIETSGSESAELTSARPEAHKPCSVNG